MNNDGVSNVFSHIKDEIECVQMVSTLGNVNVSMSRWKVVITSVLRVYDDPQGWGLKVKMSDE